MAEDMRFVGDLSPAAAAFAGYAPTASNGDLSMILAICQCVLAGRGVSVAVTDLNPDQAPLLERVLVGLRGITPRQLAQVAALLDSFAARPPDSG